MCQCLDLFEFYWSHWLPIRHSVSRTTVKCLGLLWSIPAFHLANGHFRPNTLFFPFYPPKFVENCFALFFYFRLDQQLKMGSIPGTLMAGKQTKTAVQQICIDQNSGQIRGRKEREEHQKRLSSAIELAEGKLKWRGRFGGRKRADSANRKTSLNLELANVQRRLAESERAKNELEIQLRTMEREKRELEADWARRNAEIEIHPNSVGHIFEEEIVEEQQMRHKCHCGGWIWEEEKLAQNLRERDEFWAKRMAEEMAKRLKLIEAIEAKYGRNGLAELLEEEGEKCKQTNQIKRPSTIGSNERISNANENLERRKSDPQFENPSSILTPPTRLSTASTLQSARINDNGQSQQKGSALFRPSLNLRRQNLAKGNNSSKVPTNILELEGICLDEKGILAEESEDEMEEELQRNKQSHEINNQRRASTSAKSRDSGISY